MERVKHWFFQWWQRRLPPASRVHLNQRQIFIVPTLTGYCFAGALLLMLLVAINYQNSLAYGLAFVLASLGLLTALHTWRNLAGLELQALQAAPCFPGEQAVFPLRLEAARYSRHGISLGWGSLLALQQVDVNFKQGAQVALALPAQQRGWLRAPRLRIESRFPLGIWVAWSRVDLDMRLLVYPQPVEAALPLTAACNDDESTEGLLSTQQGVDDYQGLEAWQRGDALGRIDWKAWSRGQGLWVKQFGQLQGSDMLLDYSLLQGSQEHRLSVLCHHVLRLDAEARPYSLQLPGQLLGPDSGPGHRSACLAALALFGHSS